MSKPGRSPLTVCVDRVEVDVRTTADINWSTDPARHAPSNTAHRHRSISVTVSSSADLSASVSGPGSPSATYFFRIGAYLVEIPSRLAEHKSTFQTLAVVITNATASSPETAQAAGTIEFVWDTNVASTGQVQYGISPGALTGVANDSLGTHHQIKLEGLQPGVVYYYRMTSSVPGDAAKYAVHEGSVTVNIIHGLVARAGFQDYFNGVKTTVTISWFADVRMDTRYLYFGDGVQRTGRIKYDGPGYVSERVDR